METDAQKLAKSRKDSSAQVDLVPIRTHVETYVEMDSLYKELPLLTAMTAT